MYSQEPHLNNAGLPATLTGTFTDEEIARLTDLRRSVYQQSNYVERALDETRLEFARWLKQHGKLSES